MFDQFIFNQILKRLENLEFGSLKIETPDHKIYQFSGRQQGYDADIKIHDWHVIGNLAAKSDIGFAENYSDGKWESNDLTALLTLTIQNREILDPFFKADALRRVLYQISYFFKRNTEAGSRKNIHAHYDLGNDFYKLWLDRTMSYSSALFKNNDDTLEIGQIQKYDRIIDNLNSNSGRVLEVGCGWGGFADQAMSRNKDFDLKGITLSHEQCAYAKNRLGQSASIVLEDYRHQNGKFDHIVSIEMFEAVGQKFWPVYFEKMKSLLAENGKAIVQTITIENKSFNRYRNDTDFLRTYIFPGGMLPSPDKFDDAARRAGLIPTQSFEFGLDYARTLDIWLDKFDHVYEQVKSMGFDDNFVRMWRFYLAGCSASFRTGYTNVQQVELQHA